MSLSLTRIVGNRLLRQFTRTLAPLSRNSHGEEAPEEVNCRFECFFNRRDIDGWEVRQGINDLCGYDLVPDPSVVISALHACRRVNDYAMTVRLLEAIKNKCGNKANEIYPYIVQEIAPTLCELGCDLPESLCYHKPEFYLKSVYDIH